MKVLYVFFIFLCLNGTLYSSNFNKYFLEDTTPNYGNLVSNAGEPINKKQFISDTLNEHNRLRQLHGINEKVKEDIELTKVAQNYANELAAMDKMVHSTSKYKGTYKGENLFYCWDTAKTCISGAIMTKNWYDEISLYDYNNPVFASKTGHFTQVVWKSSTSIGVGVAQSSSGKWYGVVNYYPSGNYAGQFNDNVPKKS